MTTNFLTKEGFQKLQEELDHLRTTKKQEVAKRLHEGMKGGELITKPLRFSGKTLSLNFSSSAAGEVRVEIQDASGKPLPRYTLEDCPPIFGDTLARTVTWTSGSDVHALAGTPIRLRFSLKDADVFSFKFNE